MKKILMSLLTIAIVGALLGGGAVAYFSDTETAPDNVFTAGTIDISIDPSGGQHVVTLEGYVDLKPSQTGYTFTRIHNDGTNPAEIWKHIANVRNDENDIVDAEQKYYNANAAQQPWLWDISDWIHYDLIVCSYSELCFDEGDFGKIDANEPDYEFDVCRTTEGGNVIWTLDYDVSTIPGLTHSAVQLVISSDGGATPDFQIGCNSHEADPLYKPYNGSWGSATSDLPDGMSVTGNCGDTNFEIVIPMSYLSCPDFHWAMNVEADFTGTSGSDQYRFTSAWGWGSITYYSDSCNCEVIISEAEGWTLTGTWPVECQYIYLGILQPGESMFVIQSYHLDKTVDNWGQSDRVWFDMEFVAQQVEGNPPSPGPELPGHGK